MPSRAPKVHLFRRRDTRNWWAWWRWRGRTVRQSMRTAEVEEARHRARLLERALWQKYYGLEPDPVQTAPVTLRQVFDAYRRRLVPGLVSETHAAHQRARLDRLERDLGGPDLPMTHLTTERIQAYIAARLEAGAAPDSCRGDVVAIRAAFRAAAEAGLPIVPLGRLRLPRSRPRTKIVPADHLRQILGGLQAKIGTDRAIAVCLFTGLRRSDVHRLTWEDLADGWIRLSTHKTGQVVRIPIHPWLQSFLAPVWGQGPLAPIGLRSGNVHRRTRALCGTAYGPHTLRRTFLVRLQEAGVDARVRAHLAGHASPDVTLTHYSGASDALLQEALDRLNFTQLLTQEPVTP